MSSPNVGKHARPSAPQEGPPVPEPSFAERARTLLYCASVGSLSTMSRKQSGFPFGSVMPYALDEQGRPLFLISSMAMHTQNLQADPRGSLLVTQLEATADPLGASRVTLVGNVAVLPDTEIKIAREAYLRRHANSKYWVDFEDFAFYRMQVVDVYYVGGFGVMGWVAAVDYVRAEADPLADTAAGIIEHMNADHADALVLLTRVHAGVDAQEATMTSVDRLGFHIRLKTSEGIRGRRIAFTRPVSTPEETRKVLVEMVQRARQA